MTIPGSPGSVQDPLDVTGVGAASIAASQANIGVVASRIVAARTGGVGVGRIAVTLYNNGSSAVWFGATNGVLTTTGMVLNPGAAATVCTTAALYGISSTGTQNICVLETF